MSFEIPSSAPEKLPPEELAEVFKEFPELFVRYGAQEWIGAVRVEGEDGTLDIEATARRLGVPVTYEYPSDKELVWSQAELRGATFGLNGSSPVVVYINPEQDSQSVTFGHEMGHIFISRVMKVNTSDLSHGDKDSLEAFCDYFGRQVALPFEKLEPKMYTPEDIVALASRYDMQLTDVLYRLMATGLLPGRLAVDSVRGSATNSLYRNKVGRVLVCLDCDERVPHAPSREMDEVYALDFTFRDDIFDDFEFSFECGELLSLYQHAALNESYGRWSDEDEANLREEEAHNLGRAATSWWEQKSP